MRGTEVLPEAGSGRTGSGSTAAQASTQSVNTNRVTNSLGASCLVGNAVLVDAAEVAAASEGLSGLLRAEELNPALWGRRESLTRFCFAFSRRGLQNKQQICNTED